MRSRSLSCPFCICWKNLRAVTETDSEAISRREQLRALVRVARYRPAFTAAIIGAGVFAAALEAVGLSFIRLI